MSDDTATTGEPRVSDCAETLRELDIFLDGNTWRDGSPSVDKRPLVGDLSAGVVVHWRGIRLAYSQVFRTEEFYGQRGGAQSFGSVFDPLRHSGCTSQFK